MKLGQTEDFSNVQSGGSSTASGGFIQSTFGVGSTFSDWLANNPLTNFLVGVRDYSVDEAKQKISQLYQVGLEFQDVYNTLAGYAGTAAQNPDLQADYNALLSRGNTVRSAISAAVAAVQNVVAFARDKLGIDMSDVGTPPPGLGVLQVIPAAIIAGVIGAIALATAWIVDARSAISKLEKMQQVLQTLPPEQRAAALAQLAKESGGFGTQVQKVVIWGGIAALAIIFAPQILKRLQR